jgi:D-sedoheptulose 7-phosphate isomerase
MDHQEMIEETFKSSVTHIETALTKCLTPLASAIRRSITIIENGGTLYFAGNGGSAADASHVASELIGSFEHYKHPLPAIALTTDTSIITSVANDFSYDKIFLQQAKGLVRRGDQLWLISTSGESRNLYTVATWASENKISTVGLLGRKGGELAHIVDYPITIPGENTQRIQEVHILILHTLASALKRQFPNGVQLAPPEQRMNPGTEKPVIDTAQEEDMDPK